MSHDAIPIPPLDVEAMRSARERQDRLTKPARSLGRLEDLSVALQVTANAFSATAKSKIAAAGGSTTELKAS